MMRALIVDDEAPARDRLRHLLQVHAVEIVGEAAGAAEALDGIAAHEPDVVFLDIQMPGMSGLELASRLRPPRPRIVFCTAFDEFALQAFEHHALDYLLKPVNRQRLAGTLERIERELGEQRERARELREQRERARDEAEAARTQAHLMPASGRIAASLDCAAACRPARSIGGDYYDILALGAGRVGLTVGDVSGKGLYAGLLVAALQARIQATAARGVLSPSELLRTVNRLTAGTMEGHRFATVFFGVHDPAAGVFRCASAGHPPALLVGSDGRIRTLSAGGPAIGWVDTASFDEDAVEAREGDTLVAYSDGVTEARNAAGEEFGLDRLMQALLEHRRHPPARLIELLQRDLMAFTGTAEQHDDTTLLVARVNGGRPEDRT